MLQEITSAICPGKIRGLKFERVSLAKVLRVTMRNDFKWNDHIDIITTKAAKCLHLLRQLKRAGIGSSSLLITEPAR